jgi:hypothetical protein
VIPVSAAHIGAAECGYCAVFKDREEAYASSPGPRCGTALMGCTGRRHASAGLSKLNSMLVVIAAGDATRAAVATDARTPPGPTSQVRSTC